jgi:hypothetical protein
MLFLVFLLILSFITIYIQEKSKEKKRSVMGKGFFSYHCHIIAQIMDAVVDCC